MNDEHTGMPVNGWFQSVAYFYLERPTGPPAWQAIGLRDVPRGVPDAPYIGGVPNAFILVQSKSYPVRGLDWGYYQGTYYYRQDFEFPSTGWPDFLRIMTGLLQ